MKFTTVFPLSLACLISVYVVRCSKVKLVNNGYDNVVIAINPGIPEDPKLIVKIQEMVTSASSFLYNTTKHRAYYRDVKILLPNTWNQNASYKRPTTQSYEKADVIIADPHLKHGDDPYTLQYGGCGAKGRYIHFTSNFMLNDSLFPVYGARGRVFVHEWAHLQWGVFDEYNDLVPFYFSNKETKATRCSKEIKGMTASCTGGSCSPCGIDSSTGLPNADCMFFPDQSQITTASIMYLQGLPEVAEFCNNKTHNSEAPNMQNKMCNYRSTWDVINESEDFKNNSPANIIPLAPRFHLLQARDRVLCLVLDNSGSMNTANRINKLQQAAAIFLMQIIEKGSQVCIISFNSGATIEKRLTLIENDDMRKQLIKFLPTVARGGTNICAGVLAGFKVLTDDDGAKNGDEIVLLTDGLDSTIKDCFTTVKQSGAVVHTIALGPSAAEELEQLSNMTGGLQFTASDKVNASGLIDAFTGLVSGNGDINQQSIQLESSGKSINNNGWFNGTVFVDKTVGNETFFVITWQHGEPVVLVHDPSGKTYNIGNFEINKILLTARLKINGTAQTGAWTYTIQNQAGTVQVLTITVTSRAANEKVPPVTVNAHVNQDTSAWPNPLVIYAEVSHGFLPVVRAQVKATVERADGHSVDFVLLDDGSGADAVQDDGIYSRYFTHFGGNGRYSVKVSVQGKDGVTRLAARTQGRAMYIPGYVQNGQIQQNPPKPPIVDDDSQAKLGSFSRVKSGGTCIVSQVPAGPLPDKYPPSKIMDLKATIVEDKIQLIWTAPGDDYDQGNASYYEIRLSKNFPQLKDDFQSAQRVNTTGLKPKAANSEETFMVSENIELKNGTFIYFAVRAVDKENQTSELSNIAQAALILLPIVPTNPPTPPEPSQPPSPSNPTSPPNSSLQPSKPIIFNIATILLIAGAAVIVVALIIAISVCVLVNRGHKKVSPS